MLIREAVRGSWKSPEQREKEGDWTQPADWSWPREKLGQNRDREMETERKRKKEIENRRVGIKRKTKRDNIAKLAGL